jgi:hypothetical protein
MVSPSILKHSSSWLSKSRRALILVLLALLFLFPASNLVGSSEEDDLIDRDMLFSVPAEVERWHEAVAAAKGFSLMSGFDFFVGNDDNVHRGDEILAKSSNTLGNWLYLRGDKRFGSSTRWLSTFNWSQINYQSQSQANNRRGHLSNWLESRLSNKLRIELDVDVIAENDDNTRIDGEAYFRDYSYWRYSGETRLTWRMNSHHRLRFGVEYVRKDYGELETLNSIDWSEAVIALRYRLRFAPYHYLKLWYEMSWRNYDEEKASDITGNDNDPSYPVEKHRYRNYTAWYILPLLSNRLSFNLQYEYLSKADLFRDYESWHESQYETWVTAEAASWLQITLGAEYRTRDFNHLLGDDNNLLNYDAWQFSSSARFRAARFLWLVGNITVYSRDSNRDTGTVFRDYKGGIFSAGINVFY